MANHTVPGLIAIVAVVLVVAVFLQANTASAPATNLAGQAATLGGEAAAYTCEPARYCSGTKLVIVREDCSRAEANCRYGCVDEPQAMCA